MRKIRPALPSSLVRDLTAHRTAALRVALSEQPEIPIFNGSVPPGDHTLQLVFGDATHQLFDPPLASKTITVHVKPRN